MSIAEMKVEVINKITNQENESVLKEVLELLKGADKGDGSSLNLTKNYEAIKAQYGEVLQKLAQ